MLSAMEYFENFKFKNANFNDFVAVAEDQTGEDLSWFFDEWLKTKEFCDYSVAAVKKNKIVFRRRGEIAMPVDVQIELKDGTQIKKVLKGKEKIEELPIDNAKDIKRVTLDPDEKLLDIDKINNFWPRQVEVKPVPLYHFLYEIPIFLPEDKYSLIFGPYLQDGIGLKISFQKTSYLIYLCPFAYNP